MSSDLLPVSERDADLILDDGVSLSSRLWYPRGRGPWPALLMRQPYGRQIASTVTLAHPSWWAAQGYLVVVQDVRGQGDSQGLFRGFSQEADDTAATHTWVRSLPECNGRLGCYGLSYQGLTQLSAPEGTEPPDCLTPAMTGLDERGHWSCEGGAHWWHLGLGWGLQLAALQAARNGNNEAWTEIRRSLEDGSYLRDGPGLLQRHDPDGMAWSWLKKDPLRLEDWTVHAVPDRWLLQPMLLLGGWWDPHLLGVLDLWRRSRKLGGQPELMIGPATHLQWWQDVQDQLLGFFHRHLQDREPDTNHGGTRLWNLTRRSWHPLDTPPEYSWSLCGNGLACPVTGSGTLFPTSEVEETPLGDGRGQTEQTKQTEKIVHDPWRPCPAIGGHLSPSAGAADRSDLDQRFDVATFDTKGMENGRLLSGQPELRIRVSADQPGFDLCLGLSRIPFGEKRVEQLSTGHLRVLGDGALQAAWRVVQLQPLLASLDQGDRLRLSVAAAAWPSIGVNPGCTDVPCGAPSSSHRVVTLTLHLADSRLQLKSFNSGRLQLD